MEDNQPKAEGTNTNNTEEGQQPKAEEVNAGETQVDEVVTENISSDGVEKHKLFAVVGYIVPVLFFVPLLTEAKTSKFARYHANQQLLLLLFGVIGQLVASLLMMAVIGVLLYPIIIIAGIVFMVMGVINALNGEMKELPILGKYELIK